MGDKCLLLEKGTNSTTRGVVVGVYSDVSVITHVI